LVSKTVSVGKKDTRYNTGTLKEEESRTRYKQMISYDIQERWKIIKKIIKDNEVALGFRQNTVRNEWLYETCKAKFQERNNTRIKMLQRKMISRAEEYRDERRIPNGMCKMRKTHRKMRNCYKCKLISSFVKK